MKRYINTSERELPIYADNCFTTKVGTLYRGSACSYIMKHGEAVVVLYKVSINGEYKVGFTDYLEGMQDT